MTNTKRLAILLVERPRTMKEICKELEMTELQVRSSLVELTKKHRISRAPVTYVITEEGEAFAKKVPSTSAHALAMKAKRTAERRAREREAVRQKEAETTGSMIAKAKMLRSPLENAWGGADASA